MKLTYPHIIPPGRKENANAIFFQPKLYINQPADKYEQEADAVSTQVMQMPGNINTNSFFHPLSSSMQSVQRKCAHCEEEDKIQMKSTTATPGDMIAPVAVHDTINNAGTPMDTTTRNFMESRFGYDFGQVRIHNNASAHQSSASIDAHAYTYQNHIVFAAGKYQPATNAGKQLLAHELAHVALHKHTNLLTRQKATPVTTATPMPRGSVAQKAGGFTIQIGYITIVVKPDVYNSAREKPKEAHTYMDITQFTVPNPDFDTDPKTNTVTKFKPYPALQIELTVETNYGSGINPSGPSDYGYGTRRGDPKTISFHEGSHGSEFINYIQKEIKKYPQPVFEGKTGMTKEAFTKKDDEYIAKINQIQTMLKAAAAYATQVVDCAGKSIDAHNKGRRGYQNVCP
ncbi:MAG: DUF4157 domain-containing protein [Chitinophagaceae bacterium]|nr:DUF4157 domain-containing protein [Chitinophagaceae bacterium]